jgi:pyrroline-5-carboxylate reductase
MGGILLQAFLKQNLFAADQIHATVAHAERALALSAQWGVDVGTDNLEAASSPSRCLTWSRRFVPRSPHPRPSSHSPPR